MCGYGMYSCDCVSLRSTFRSLTSLTLDLSLTVHPLPMLLLSGCLELHPNQSRHLPGIRSVFESAIAFECQQCHCPASCHTVCLQRCFDSQWSDAMSQCLQVGEMLLCGKQAM